MERVEKQEKHIILKHVLLILAVLAAITFLPLGQRDAHAASAGFKTINGKSYYIKKDGSKQKGWLTLNGKKYYFNKKTGVQLKGWQKDSDGNLLRYFYKTSGAMAVGSVPNGKGDYRYFDKKTGIMTRGWLTLNGYKYYFYSTSGLRAKGLIQNKKGQYRLFRTNGRMVTGWYTSSSGNTYFYHKTSGIQYRGLKKISGKYYYFSKGYGILYKKGFGKIGSDRYYFSPSDGHAQTGWLTLNGKMYYFSSQGIMYVSKTATLNGIAYLFAADGTATETKIGKRTFTVFDEKNQLPYTMMNEYKLHPGVADGTKTDLDLLAAVCEAEAGDQGLEGMEAVAMCVLNSTIDPAKEFPSSVRYVIYQGSDAFPQYSVVTDGALLKRLNGQYYDRELAYKAAREAMKIFNNYVKNGTPRTIKGFKKKDFDYRFFMTEPAFYAQPLNFSKVDFEKFREHVFFVDWV